MELALEELVALNTSLLDYRQLILIATIALGLAVGCFAFVMHRRHQEEVARHEKLGHAKYRALKNAAAAYVSRPDRTDQTTPPSDAAIPQTLETSAVVKSQASEPRAFEQSHIETLVLAVLIPEVRRYASALAKLRGRMEASDSHDDEGPRKELNLEFHEKDFWSNVPGLAQSDCAGLFSEFEQLRREIVLLTAALDAAREVELDDRQVRALVEAVVALEEQASRLKTTLSLFEDEEVTQENVFRF